MIPFLEFIHLAKNYGSLSALTDVSFPVERQSVVALLGPNGAGKSTLFGCLLGLVHLTAGRIALRGQPITDADRVRFGYVSERVALYPQRTVLENARLFARLKGQTDAEATRQLERVGLASLGHRRAGQLSKGMWQRLGLAIALCGEPELLVLDEPFNGLDPVLLDTLRTILRAENRRGATLLISTHTMSAVEPLATHVAILLEGRLAAYGELHDVRRANGGDSLEAAYHHIARHRHPVVQAKEAA